MADFYQILNRAISALPENTGTARRSVYERARNALIKQLETLGQPLDPSDVTRQRLQLEEAIRKVEAEYASAMYSNGRPDTGADHAVEEPETQDTGPDEAENAQTQESMDPEAKIEQAKVILKDAVRDAEQLGRRPDEKKPKSAGNEPAPVGVGALDTGRSEPALDATKPVERLAPDMSADEQTKSKAPLFIGLAVLGFVGIGLAAAYTQKDAIQDAFLGGSDKTQSADVLPSPASDTAASEERDPPKTVRKVDDRVPDEGEGEPSPDSESVASAEGTTVVTKSEPVTSGDQTAETPTAEPDNQTPAEQSVSEPDVSTGTLIGSRGLLYEEANGDGQQAKALTASVAWTLLPSDATNKEPVIKGRVSVPDRGMTLELLIKKNLDQSLPASHLIELQFAVPSDFTGGAVQKVPGVVMKTEEQARGRALSAESVKVADNFFWIALSTIASDQDVNEELLKTQNWIDIPLQYSDKKRAILTLQKGKSGARVFDAAFKAWAE